MALMPKRVKHRKSQRGRIKGNATRGNKVVFGDFGLQSLEGGWIKAEVTEHNFVATSRVTFYTPSLAFSVLDSLGHQRHRRLLRTYLG